MLVIRSDYGESRLFGPNHFETIESTLLSQPWIGRDASGFLHLVLVNYDKESQEDSELLKRVLEAALQGESEVIDYLLWRLGAADKAPCEFLSDGSKWDLRYFNSLVYQEKEASYTSDWCAPGRFLNLFTARNTVIAVWNRQGSIPDWWDGEEGERDILSTLRHVDEIKRGNESEAAYVGAYMQGIMDIYEESLDRVARCMIPVTLWNESGDIEQYGSLLGRLKNGCLSLAQGELGQARFLDRLQAMSARVEQEIGNWHNSVLSATLREIRRSAELQQQSLEVEREEAKKREHFNHVIALLGALVVGPSLVAAIYGANVSLPHQQTRLGLWFLLGGMVLAGLVVHMLIRLVGLGSLTTFGSSRTARVVSLGAITAGAIVSAAIDWTGRWPLAVALLAIVAYVLPGLWRDWRRTEADEPA